MRTKLLFLVLISSLVVPIPTYTQTNQVTNNSALRGNIQKNEDMIFSGENEIWHIGDIIVNGTNTCWIANCTFLQCGNIIVKDQGTLKVENANLTIVQEYANQYWMDLENSAKMETHNAVIHSNSTLPMFWFNSKVRITSTLMTENVSLGGIGSPDVFISKSTVDSMLYAANYAQFNISASKINQIQFGCCSPEVWMTDSKLETLVGCAGGTIHAVSSPINNIELQSRSTVKIYIYWYLDAHIIDSENHDVSSANVTITSQNGTMTDSKLTNLNGWANFTLLEKTKDATGNYPVGNYTVTATYQDASAEETLNMTNSRQMIVTIPEFPSFLIVPSFMVATLLAVIAYRRKLTH